MSSVFDVIIVGAGAAGLMCAIEAGRRGRSVVLLEHSVKPAEKIRISGGGRCNFTNVHTAPSDFLSANPRFCISALKGFTPQDFTERVEEAGIPFHEKTLGQLFCDDSSDEIIQMLLGDARKAGVQLRTQTSAQSVSHEERVFTVRTGAETLTTSSFVVATGGRSIPKMGASGFATDIAAQFDINVLPQRAGLVPLTFSDEMKAQLGDLTGVSLDVEVAHGKTRFREALLFTHRGLSGPAILQISSYWREGNEIQIDLTPGLDIAHALLEIKRSQPRQSLVNVLSECMPKRLAQVIADEAGGADHLAELSDKALAEVGSRVNRWRIRPQGSEGYRTAEVTLGGIDTRALSSKTMEVRDVPGLYFIGEAVDVTGHLGGFNFQWAWASGFAAGQVV
jgi:hypothetical protein